MSLESDTVDQIRDLLTQIEDKKIQAHDGFKRICWLADVYVISAELEESRNIREKIGVGGSPHDEAVQAPPRL